MPNGLGSYLDIYVSVSVILREFDVLCVDNKQLISH